MENLNLNSSFCVDTFGDELDVTEEPDGVKTQAKQHRDWQHNLHERDMGILQKVVGVLQKMDSF